MPYLGAGVDHLPITRAITVARTELKLVINIVNSKQNVLTSFLHLQTKHDA